MVLNDMLNYWVHNDMKLWNIEISIEWENFWELCVYWSWDKVK